MFLLQSPNDEIVEQFLIGCAGQPFSYPEVGATKSDSPLGYNIDHNRIKIGSGRADFEMARMAIRDWEMFNLSWVRLFPQTAPIEGGQTVAIAVSHLGFYSLNAARIVYTIDEKDGIHRFGFAYGTLAEHGEIGEERFSVEWHRESDEVWYDLFAFSRPGSILAKLGYPISRQLQRRFAADSLQAMKRFVTTKNEKARG